MSVPLEEHPLLRCLASVGAALDDVSELDPAFLPTPDKARALRAVDRELSRLEGLRLRLLAASGDVAADEGARSAGVWLAAESRASSASGVRAQRLAEALPASRRGIRRAVDRRPDECQRGTPPGLLGGCAAGSARRPG